MRHLRCTALLFIALCAIGCQSREAPLFDNLGDYRYATSTRDPLARRYFDQGMVLAFGFNHAEAARSFRESARLDPQFAMAHWGVALVLGPHINAPMDPDNVAEAFDRSRRAAELEGSANEKEQALIAALQNRYTQNPPEDRSPLDTAYADAMRDVAQRFPDDSTVQALFAEALMDLHPWDYWQADGQPQPWTNEIVTTLEKTLKADPNHPLSNHLYIHAVEASPNPGRAEAAADRLVTLAPGAGHLVHMPSHIYIHLGRYHDASRVNQLAIEADQDYVTACRAQGLYPMAYHPHNIHFLWAAATLEGRAKVAIDAALALREKVDKHARMHPQDTTAQHFWSVPLLAWVKFERWDEVVSERKPTNPGSYAQAVWHWARGMALTARGELGAAQVELDTLKTIAADPSLEELKSWDVNSRSHRLRLAVAELSGALLTKRGQLEAAIKALEAGVEAESTLKYIEPPDWNPSVRQQLGATLLKAGRAAEAERVYRDDLSEFPANGWALHGMVAALKAQGKDDEAKAAQQQFESAWQHADFDLDARR